MSVQDRIVTAARGWIGTRFHHQGRLKKNETHKGGVDCLGLLVGVAGELHLTAHDHTTLSSLDRADYSHYPDTLELRKKLQQHLREIPTDRIAPGDIVLLAIDGQPQHMAIVSDDRKGGLGLIHAYAPARAVVEHALDAWWRKRIVHAYSVVN